MRPRFMVCSAALAVAAVLAVPALGALTPKDEAAVKAGLANAKLLQKQLTGLRTEAAREAAFQLGPCRAKYQPTEDDQQVRLNQLLGLEVLRQLQHNGLPFYATFIRKQQRQALSDARLKTAQRALASELATARKLIAVPITMCADLDSFAQQNYSQAALEAWARAIDAQAGVSEAAALRIDARVKASRRALLQAGLTAKTARLVLDAETGDIFADVLSGPTG
jgi:hypothetical protein